SLEEVANQRQAANDRYLRYVHTLLRDDDTADNHSPAIFYEHLGLCRLRVQRRCSLDAWNTRVDLGILDDDIHEGCSLGCNLGRILELENRVDETNGDCVVDRGLNWNLRALLDHGLFVVLRHYAGLVKQFANALRFRGRDEKVDRKVR